MTIKIASVAAVCLLAASSLLAQNANGDDIVGGGTTNYVPLFTGSHRIGNSNICDQQRTKPTQLQASHQKGAGHP